MNMALARGNVANGAYTGIQSTTPGRFGAYTHDNAFRKNPTQIGSLLSGNSQVIPFGSLTEKTMAMNTGQPQKVERSKHSDAESDDEKLTKALGMDTKNIMFAAA